MTSLLKTFFNGKHRQSGATMVDFGGWDMPVQYESGVIQEHLACRKKSGLFDVSHMGRFIISGPDAIGFLQHVLSNNATALEKGKSQYTIIPDEDGYAIDDAYLYRFKEKEYMLVVNASNREKDWAHFMEQAKNFQNLELTDQTFEMGMLSLQGPLSNKIITNLIESGSLPAPQRNNLSCISIAGAKVNIARTGYTGDPLGLELFMDKNDANKIWDLLIEEGTIPIGLGARDTLRLEASLPLYGHEFGDDPEKKPIPIFACPLAKFAVSFAPQKGDFIGKPALLKQFNTLKRIKNSDYADIKALPRIISPLTVTGRGIAREGYEIHRNDSHVGYITSGTMVPFWKTGEEGTNRAIALALLDADISQGDVVEIKIRKKMVSAVVVPYNMKIKVPDY